MSLLRTALTVLTVGSATLATIGCEQRQVEDRRDDMAARPIGETDRTPTDVTRPLDPVNPVDRTPTLDDDRSGAGPIDKKTTANDPTIRSIATARCEREASCNNLGADKKFASRDACMSEILDDLGDELNLSECPGGVVQKELDECLAEIKNESCNNPIDKIERLAACRESDLCKAIN